MDQLIERTEIAEIEWRRITSIAWPTLLTIFAIQALFAENEIQRWQILYVIGLMLTGMISWILSRRTKIVFSHTPTVLYLLFSPLVLGNVPSNPWMSLGLPAFAAVIYYSAIKSLPFAISVIILIATYQTYIAQLNLISVTDNSDISYFYSYFSNIWIVIMGVASILIQRRYLSVASSVQETVNYEIETSLSRLKNLKQINQNDSRNLRLHGTVLNTLIHIRNLVKNNLEIDQSKKILLEEIRNLVSENKIVDARNFMEKLEGMISNRALNRIKVSITPFTDEVNSSIIEESLLEIIREILLNSEKHTEATTATVLIVKKSGSAIHLTYIDNATLRLPKKERSLLLEKTTHSRSLQNLLKQCGATIETSLSKGNRYRKIDIRIPYVDLERELKTTLARSRVSGLNDFALNYVRASALVALLSLPGYIFVGLDQLTIFFTITTVLGFHLALNYPQRKVILSSLLLSSLLIIPSISRNVESCTDLGASPWLFNHVLTVGFFFCIQFKNQVIKWLPIFILSIQSIYYPFTYPTACNNIFLGSLPAIPLIIVLALSVLSVRKREVYFDETESLEITQLGRVLSASDNFREQAYSTLLRELSIFAEELEQKSKENLKHEVITLQIHKIQTFLVCAEHFESKLICEIYEVFRDRLMAGIPGKLSLMGESFEIVDYERSINLIVKGLRDIMADREANLTMINVQNLEFHFQSTSLVEKPDSIYEIPIIYES